MNPIRLLDSETIDKIAAGEVVERPANVVKELTENSIDGHATIINVEIKNGGIDLIRVTDNGSGIENNQVKTAFLRHATSKLTTIADLDSLVSLGFRGEALSSISAVSMTEMITKTEDALLGTHISIEGGKITEFAEVGAPKGTTVIVRQLFYNTPARRKFLKSPQSEAARIEEVVERIAISHPEISFSFTVNGKTKFTTSGNGSVKDVIYRVYGREIYERLLDIDHTCGDNHIYGYVARPEYNLGTRELEIFLVNKRLVSSKELSVSVENGYHGFLMQHRFPFCVVFIDTDPATLDVNVHPQKAEIRFSEIADVSNEIAETVAEALHEPELIPVVEIDEPKPQVTYTVSETTVDSLPEGVEDTKFEPFAETGFPSKPEIPVPPKKEVIPQAFETRRYNEVIEKVMEDSPKEEELTYKQQDLFEERLIDDKPLKEYKIIGQVFKTYWLISLNDNLYIVDQHAAHEKVNYETFLKAYLSDESIATQMISPPVVVSLTPGQAVILNENLELFYKIGYEIEDFGDKSYAIRGVPMNLYGFEQRELFMSLIEEISVKDKVYTPELILAKLASMSCKAAIKGNNTVSYEEMKVLMDKLMSLDNPYNCPHGRPTFICITKTELDKKFKRIV
ncbi:MAG: DNA mismatch repair endonuclease MutL [Lachnospiraceae bacterium]|nr:DNA mismatch repair endonuclease MutL [Lachnospiraceae bacterium]